MYPRLDYGTIVGALPDEIWKSINKESKEFLTKAHVDDFALRHKLRWYYEEEKRTIHFITCQFKKCACVSNIEDVRPYQSGTIISTAGRLIEVWSRDKQRFKGWIFQAEDGRFLGKNDWSSNRKDAIKYKVKPQLVWTLTNDNEEILQRG